PQEQQRAAQPQGGHGGALPVDLGLAGPAAGLRRARAGPLCVVGPDAAVRTGVLLAHQTTGSKVAIRPCSSLIQLAHTPVIRSTPIAISSAPESRPMLRRWADSFLLSPSARSNSSAKSTKGMPRPRE